MNDLPTREQIKEFWGWWGVKEDKHNVRWRNGYPYINSLDSLFWYAVPKVVNIFGGHPCHISLHYSWGDSTTDYGVEITCPTLFSARLALQFNRSPALALFWAIWKVMKEKAAASSQRSE